MVEEVEKQVQECLAAAEEIQAAGIIKDKLNTSFKEHVRYEFLKFLAYLSRGDGLYTDKEKQFVKKITGFDAGAGMINAVIASEHLADKSYMETVPFTLKYFVLADAGEKMKDHKRRTVNLINTFRNLGQEYIACNEITS